MHNLPTPKAVLFDWDNTLVDTWPTIHAALNQTYKAFGKELWSLDEVKANIRYSLRDSFPRYFGDQWKDASHHFYTSFEQVHLTELSPIPGAENLLSKLKDKGVYTGIVSNKTGKYLRKEVSHLGWEPFFGCLVGAGDASRDKPAPDPVHMALEKSGLEADSSVWFVGDSNVDMEIAHATGCTAILIKPEAEDEDDLSACPPHLRSPDCRTLIDFIEQKTN